MFSMCIKTVKDHVACTRKIKVHNNIISWCLLNFEREDDEDYKKGLRPWDKLKSGETTLVQLFYIQILIVICSHWLDLPTGGALLTVDH